MTNYESLSNVTEDFLRKNPEQINLFVAELFDDYFDDNDSVSLLQGLRIVARAKGVTQLANNVGITRAGLQKALSSRGNPRLDNLGAIVKAMGYRLNISPT